MIKALIFDMDGLLVDSEPYWDEARRLLVIGAGHNWDWNPEDQKSVMGRSTREWVSFMVDRFNLDLTPHAVEQQLIENMVTLYQQQIPFLPGAEEIVSLSSKSFLTGLASGSPLALIETVIKDQAINGKFQTVLSGDQFAHGKPAPDIYQAAATQLGVQPQDCVCFEDSANGILAGKAAGMKVIAVPDQRFNPATEGVAEADLVLASLQDVTLDTIAGLA